NAVARTCQDRTRPRVSPGHSGRFPRSFVDRVQRRTPVERTTESNLRSWPIALRSTSQSTAAFNSSFHSSKASKYANMADSPGMRTSAISISLSGRQLPFARLPKSHSSRTNWLLAAQVPSAEVHSSRIFVANTRLGDLLGGTPSTQPVDHAAAVAQEEAPPQ